MLQLNTIFASSDFLTRSNNNSHPFTHHPVLNAMQVTYPSRSNPKSTVSNRKHMHLDLVNKDKQRQQVLHLFA